MNKNYHKNTLQKLFAKDKDRIYKRSDSPLFKMTGINAQNISNLLGDNMPAIPHLSGSTEYRKFGTEEKDREDDIFGNSDSQLLKWQDINMKNLQSISDGRITKSAEFSGTEYKEFGTEEKDRKKRTFTDEKTTSLKGEDFDKKYRSFLENDKLPKNTEFKSVPEDKKPAQRKQLLNPEFFGSILTLPTANIRRDFSTRAC